MKALVFALLFAAAASAQIVPDEFPDGAEPMMDRSNRELAERHRPFLSGLFATSGVVAGPRIAQPDLIGGALAEGGYRFGSGDAVALTFGLQSPLDRAVDPLADETSATIGLAYVVGLGRGRDRRSVLRGAEVALGAGATVFAEGTVTTLSLSPRLALPLSPVLALPVGVIVSQEIGAPARPTPFVGLTVGLRRIWADPARMVLE